MLNRVSGKLCFATLRDWTGDLQVMVSLNDAGEENLAAWKSDVDLGDIVGVTGEVITSKRGELSVLPVTSSLRPSVWCRSQTSTKGTQRSRGSSPPALR